MIRRNQMGIDEYCGVLRFMRNRSRGNHGPLSKKRTEATNVYKEARRPGNKAADNRQHEKTNSVRETDDGFTGRLMIKKYLMPLLVLPLLLCGYEIPDNGIDYGDAMQAAEDNEIFEISPGVRAIDDVAFTKDGVSVLFNIDTSRVTFGTPGEYDIYFIKTETFLPEYIKLHGVFRGAQAPRDKKITHSILKVTDYEDTGYITGEITEPVAAEQEETEDLKDNVSAQDTSGDEADAATLEEPVYIDMGNGNEIAVDNSASGRLIIGDSRAEQLYMYGSTRASFVAVWGGNYYGSYDLSINTLQRIDMMRSFADNARDATGDCKIFIMCTVNDYDGGGYYKNAADDVLSLADDLRDHGDIYILELVGMKNVNVSDYNGYIEIEAGKRGYYTIPLSGCLSGDNDGYLSDDLHFTEQTIANIWAHILEV